MSDQHTALTTRSIDTPSGRISYIEAGSGPVALFVHGVLLNKHVWHRQLTGLSDTRRCIAVDFLAHGDTEIDSNQDVSVSANANMLREALDALKIKPGMVVADVGAGTGYMSLKLAKRVGTSGKVYAEDVQPEMLDQVRTNAAKAGVKNIETVQGSFTDPKLPKGQMDLVLLVDVYHEFSEPQKMLQGIRDSLKRTP